MAGSVNKVIIVGNLGRDPEIRHLQSGEKVAQLNIATSENWRDRASGERRERTEWHRVVIFNPNLADIAERFLKKGSKVYVEGQLQTRKWQDQSGAEKFTTEIVLSRFRGELTLLDSRGGGPGAGESGGGYESDRGYGGGSAGGGGGFGNEPSFGGGSGRPAAGRTPPPSDLDDDIPF